MDSIIRDRLTQRLASMGYTYDATTDGLALEMLLEKTEARIRHACNIDEIPDDLQPEVIDAVCGEFIADLKATGRLTGVGLEGIVKAITEGDTRVEFATGNAGAADYLDATLARMMEFDQDAIAAHRRLAW